MKRRSMASAVTLPCSPSSFLHTKGFNLWVHFGRPVDFELVFPALVVVSVF